VQLEAIIGRVPAFVTPFCTNLCILGAGLRVIAYEQVISPQMGG
jgi:hypothetical protein